MSLRLNDGSNFRIIENNKDVTTNPKIDPNNAKIQIDTDKDGKFDGEKDITITDKAQISLLTDNEKGNTESIKSIPFVDEIEEHILKNKIIDPLIEKAKKFGDESENTSIFNLDKKLETGKIAFDSVRKAFDTDKSNPDAKFAFGMSVLKLHQSAFSSMAEQKLGINLKEYTREITTELEKDKFDIIGQILLKEIYNETGSPSKAKIELNLSELKNKFPNEYKKSEQMFKELSK